MSTTVIKICTNIICRYGNNNGCREVPNSTAIEVNMWENGDLHQKWFYTHTHTHTHAHKYIYIYIYIYIKIYIFIYKQYSCVSPGLEAI